MKRVLTVLMALALALGCVGFASAEVIQPYGMGQIGYMSAVLCEELTLRQTPSSTGKEVAKIEYGSLIIVMSVENGWAYVTMGDSEESPIGYVNADYIVIDPSWYKTTAKTTVYAWNDTAAPKVGLLDEGIQLPILKIEGDWVLVSLRGAVGWIRK